MPLTTAYLLSKLFRWSLFAFAIWIGWEVGTSLRDLGHAVQQGTETRATQINGAVS